MQRIELVMDARTRGWLVQVAKKNYWRVAAHIDLDDLVQDGFVVWHHVQQRYREQGRIHSHIVNTFKRAYRNHLHDLSNARTRAPMELQLLDAESSASEDYEVHAPRQAVERLAPLEHGAQELLMALKQAPFKVREVLKLFNDPAGLERMRRPYRIRGDGSRETLNERLCRMAGFDATRVNLVEAVQAYLLSD